MRTLLVKIESSFRDKKKDENWKKEITKKCSFQAFPFPFPFFLFPFPFLRLKAKAKFKKYISLLFNYLLFTRTNKYL